MRLWIALLLHRYGSPPRAPLEAQAGSAVLPPLDASPEALFQKVQKVRPALFQNAFRAYPARLKGEAPSPFKRVLPLDPKLLSEVHAVDG